MSGNSFAVPSGFQYAHEGKNYKLMIRTFIPLTQKYANITYSITVVYPAGDMPLIALL